MRIVFAGGGTGGHVIPALAIARELRDAYAADVLFIGTSRGIENRLVPAAGFPLRLIEVGALKKVSVIRRLKTFFALPRALFAAWRLLREYRPAVVIGVGGYASGPAMLAAVVSGIPTIAFESNLVPGFANRVVARMVTAAAVHFEETCRFFPNCRVTGVPVRREFFHASEAASESSPSLLVFGGSQGSHAINQAMLGALSGLAAALPGLRIVHQTGERDHAATQAEYSRVLAGSPVSTEAAPFVVAPFIEDMPAAFAAADLVISRSGASTVAEVAAAGKPAIFVPFPFAADDHQRRNAEAMERAGAALLLPESEMTSERLLNAIVELLADCPRLERMSNAARAMSHPDAAKTIAGMAAQLAGARAERRNAVSGV